MPAALRRYWSRRRRRRRRRNPAAVSYVRRANPRRGYRRRNPRKRRFPRALRFRIFPRMNVIQEGVMVFAGSALVRASGLWLTQTVFQVDGAMTTPDPAPRSWQKYVSYLGATAGIDAVLRALKMARFGRYIWIGGVLTIVRDLANDFWGIQQPAGSYQRAALSRGPRDYVTTQRRYMSAPRGRMGDYVTAGAHYGTPAVDFPLTAYHGWGG